MVYIEKRFAFPTMLVKFTFYYLVSSKHINYSKVEHMTCHMHCNAKPDMHKINA